MDKPEKKPRGPAKATIAALQHARRLKSPSKQKVMWISKRYGVHWTTIYRGLAEKA